MFGTGISSEGDLLDLAVKKDIVKKSGAWFAYNNEKIGQGRENAKQFLIDHPDVKDEIWNLVKESYKIGGDENPSDENPSVDINNEEN